MTTFQTILLAVFGLLILIGVLIFAGYGPGGNSGNAPAAQLSLWGTLDSNAITQVVQKWNDGNPSIGVITYSQHDPATFERELLNALATGHGPDMVLLSNQLLATEADKLLLMPYSQISARTYLDTYVDGTSLFATNKGILAMPLVGDPLVLYWNKDLFASANVATPPAYWDEVLTLAPKLTIKDAKGNIIQSAIALGGYRNVNNAKDLLVTLFSQVGDPIANLVSTDSGSSVSVVLGNTTAGELSPAESALRFFTQFANPSEAAYSWNRGLGNSHDQFLAGKLALYVGYAHEFDDIRKQNPHLSFDVTTVPTIRPSQTVTRNTNVGGSMLAIATLAQSHSPANALEAEFILSTQPGVAAFSQVLGLPPLRRDLLGDVKENPFATVFNRATLSLHSWFDSSPAQSDLIFRDMVESVLSGAAGVRSAIDTAHAALQALATQ